MFRRSFFSVLLALLSVIGISAQIFNPVKWSSSIVMTDDNTGEIVYAATISHGWHVYSNDIDPEVGPSPLNVSYHTLEGVTLNGSLHADKKPHSEYDEMFAATLSWWESSVILRQNFTATEPAFTITGNISYSACNNENCIPPTKESFNLSGTAKINRAEIENPVPITIANTLKGESATPTVAQSIEPVAETDSAENAAKDLELSTDSEVEKAHSNDLNEEKTAGNDFLWEPVDFNNSNTGTSSSSNSMWYIFFTCFLGGFLALLTPCVWPMIPMTVSFFLKKSKSRSKSIIDASIYGISIIAIYLALGLIITAIFGASSLNALSTSAVCNIIFFILLVVFAISFFGAFDITLPSSWSNKMDSTAEKTTGLFSIFFMAFTLVLVSFSCTGPIIGTLLVEAASTGDKMGPAIGMFGFSLALAIPFFLFAVFPSLLQSAPKSGNWMNTIKVILGFIELALSLKFLSVADLAYGWHILDREVFIVLWVTIFILLGLYLLGQFNFAHYGKADSSVGVFRFFLSITSISFAVYLIPGLWGAPLKAVSAFVPPLSTQDFNLYGRDFIEYHDYEEGLAVARREGKPALIDFSGYGCVNCRKMEGAVLDNERVHNMIEENFVVIKLMVDEKKALPEPIKMKENGKLVTLESYGDKWSYLQRHKFNANAQPYYVILNDKGELLSGPVSYDENISRFINFLSAALH